MFPELPLELSGAPARALIAPRRGAIVTSLSVNSTELLYLDRDTFSDPARSVRGGIPLLYPFCGRLDEERFLAAGTTMPQHGFARNQPWTVLEHGGDTLNLEMDSSADVRQAFPYDFTLRSKFLLSPRGLRIELTTHNRSDRPMPLSPGWHPYFPCAPESKEQVRGNIPGMEPGCIRDSGTDGGVVAPPDGRVRIQIPGLPALWLSFSPEMRHVQLWTLPGKPFVCIEPFHGPPNTINGPNAMVVPPGAVQMLWMAIEVAD